MTDDQKQISDDWKIWTAENLADGADPEEIRQALLDEGAPATLVTPLIEGLSRSPFLRLAKQQCRTLRRHQLVARLRRERLRQLEIGRYGAMSGHTFHSQYRAAQHPIILTELLRDLPALARWSFEWFAKVFDRIPMGYRPEPLTKGTKMMATNELMALFRSKGCTAYSAARCGVLKDPSFRRLLEDILIPEDYVPHDIQRRFTSMWIGPAGTFTPLHYDMRDTLLAQIVGRKRVTLIPPCEEALYTWMQGNVIPTLDENVPRIRVDLIAGEALLLPAGWCHEVEALAPSISLSMTGIDTEGSLWFDPPSG